jgi:hypothetical protein
MMYMFISEKQAEKIKQEFNIDVRTRKDVIITKPIPESSGWVCKECDRELSRLMRCSCGSYNIVRK